MWIWYCGILFTTYTTGNLLTHEHVKKQVFLRFVWLNRHPDVCLFFTWNNAKKNKQTNKSKTNLNKALCVCVKCILSWLTCMWLEPFSWLDAVISVGSASDVTEWAVRASSAHLRGRSGGTGSAFSARPQLPRNLLFVPHSQHLDLNL